MRVVCHSNGDREIDMMLTAVEDAQARQPRPDARPRIEHCSVVRQDLLDRIKQDGVVIVPHSYEWEHGDKLSSYGEKRWEWMFPNKRGIDMGIPVAGHSDSPIGAADPMLRIHVSSPAPRGRQGNRRFPADTLRRPHANLDSRRGLRHVRREDQGDHRGGNAGGFRRALGRSHGDPRRLDQGDPRGTNGDGRQNRL